MDILYVASKYDWGKPERGYGPDHYNFYDTLCRMGHNLLYFDFATFARERGREGMNRHLLDIVAHDRPTLMFTVLAYEDQLEPAVVKQISDGSETVTLNWFCDDHFRFDNYTRYWAPCFNWVVTTDENSLPKYASLGHKNVILSQWACNPYLYRKLDLPKIFDVTFVGTRLEGRTAYVDALKKAGLSVRTWGSGWDSNRLSQDDMIAVFNQSRINLSFTGSACPLPELPEKPHVGRRAASRCLESLPFGGKIKKALRRSVEKVKSNQSLPSQVFPKQIKGRTFEVPGCGALLLTENVAHLDKYYDTGKEVMCFVDSDDLIGKVRYCLSNQAEAEQIASAGYKRTLAAHTYRHRLTDIFQRLGLAA